MAASTFSPLVQHVERHMFGCDSKCNRRRHTIVGQECASAFGSAVSSASPRPIDPHARTDTDTCAGVRLAWFRSVGPSGCLGREIYGFNRSATFCACRRAQTPGCGSFPKGSADPGCVRWDVSPPGGTWTCSNALSHTSVCVAAVSSVTVSYGAK
ncbi:hypothetical protein ZHAS_00016777 [Anopheles sinensis]|uniref:Uncharacterized protein n=1 Tax=Anopheles sinensis TaxID=74873 RepID=A0A084WE69_ANOSI|nr:hypothetical protein ZHAS_00016777 [Anopheles sinensis]